MWSSLSKGLIAVGTMTAYFAGCGGSSVRHGAPDDGKGHGGTGAGSAKGGTGGTGAGRNGGTGAQGGDIAVSTGGGPARGGTGGGIATGGTVGKGGTTGKGGSPGKGGTSGTSGSAGAPEPTCDCTRYEDLDEFSCHASEVLVPSKFAEPATCEIPDARVRRIYCDDGSAHYTFVEGEENLYDLVIDGDGDARYFHANGFVGALCNLDPNEVGTVTLGALPDSECFEACALCGSYEDLPPCLACTPDANDPSSVNVALPAYCEQNYCPATIAEAREHLNGTCTNSYSGTISVGCGLVTVERVFGFSETTYVFNEQNGELVGIKLLDDLPFGLCHASSYRVGNVPDGPCGVVATCEFCAPDTGEGGAAGAAGAAGAGNGSLCEP